MKVGMVGFIFKVVAGIASIFSGFFPFFSPHTALQVKGLATLRKPYAYITTVPSGTSSAVTVAVSPFLSQKEKPTITGVLPNKVFVSNAPSPTLIPSPQTEVTVSLSATQSSFFSRLTPTLLPTPILIPVVSTGLNGDKILSLINQYRNKNNLPSFEKNDQVCAVAATRAPQVFNEIFITGNLDAGLKAMNLPFWATESIINDDSEADAVDWWTNDPSHRNVILGNYTYSCVACSGFNCAEIFTSLIKK